MTRYRKRPVHVKIEPVTERRTIETMEGRQEVGPGQYLATGAAGEQYAFGQEVFDTYEPAEGRPGFYVKRGDTIVEAMRLAYPVEIFRPGWEHRGKAGDWLVALAPDDQYIVDAELFEQTYEPVHDAHASSNSAQHA